MEYSWISVPTGNALEDKSRWTMLGNDKYAGLRHVLLIIEQNPIIKNGPLVDQVEWPINSEYSHQHRKTNIIKYTAGINESITSAITQQLSTEVISNVKSGLSAGKVLSATLSTELTEKVNTQLTETLIRALSVTKTFETQEENEITQTLKFTVPKKNKNEHTRKVSIYNKVKEIRWDVYLYRSDYLQLEYHKKWFWKDVRKTIQTDSAILKIPLFSIIFYEPIPSPSYVFDEFEPEVPTASEIITQQLLKPCPTKSLPELLTLEQLAKLSFPVTKVEKKEANKRIAVKKSPSASSGPYGKFRKKAAMKKMTLKRTATKKASTKKASSKKTSTGKSGSKANGNRKKRLLK